MRSMRLRQEAERQTYPAHLHEQEGISRNGKPISCPTQRSEIASSWRTDFANRSFANGHVINESGLPISQLMEDRAQFATDQFSGRRLALSDDGGPKPENCGAATAALVPGQTTRVAGYELAYVRPEVD